MPPTSVCGRGKPIPVRPPRPENHCCQHNFAQGWPYFAEYLWLATRGNGLASIFYAPCRIQARVGEGAVVRIQEETDYPFGEIVDFSLSTPKTVVFNMMLRIPRWCREAGVTINGEAPIVRPSPGIYLVIQRTWRDGDCIRLKLPMAMRSTVWEKTPVVARLRIAAFPTVSR